MSATNTFEQDVLKHLLQNLNIALIGDATGLRGSIVPGVLYISLHTGDPGESGDQTTLETPYPGYTRISVVRSAAGWTVSSPGGLSQGVNAADVTFPAENVGGTPSTVTYFGIGTAASGVGSLLLSGILAGALVINPLIAPYFPAGTLVVTCD